MVITNDNIISIKLKLEVSNLIIKYVIIINDIIDKNIIKDKMIFL